MSTTPTSTSYAVHGPVAVVTLNNPPVNGLGHALRSGIVAALDQALADPQVQAIVLTGSARAFSGGADVREFGTPKAGQEPTLPSVIRALDGATKPVVAAIHSVPSRSTALPSSSSRWSGRPTSEATGVALPSTLMS